MNKTFIGVVVFAAGAYAQEPKQIIEEVQRRSRSNSQRYEGTLEVVGAGNRIATKRWAFERIGSFGDSKALLRFTAPAEVKGVALLIVNHPDRASDQWMWRPNIGPRPANRFAGSVHTFSAPVSVLVGGARCSAVQFQASRRRQWKLENRIAAAQILTIRVLVLWVKKDNYTIVKVEAYSKSRLVRTIDYRDFSFQATSGRRVSK